MQQLRKLWSNQGMVKNVLTLLTGTALAQLLSVLSMPLLTRLYSPDDFGSFGVLFAWMSVLSIITTLRFELGLVTEPNLALATKLFKLSFRIIGYSSLLVLVIVSLVYCIGSISSIYFFLPPLVFFQGISQLLINARLRVGEFNRISVYRMASSLIIAISSIILGYLGWGTIGLIVANVLAMLVGVSLLFSKHAFYREISKEEEVSFNWKDYAYLPKLNLPQGLNDLFQVNGVFYILPFFLDKEIIGFYAMAIRVIQMPMSLAGSSIAQVFYKKAAENWNQGFSNVSLFWKTIKLSIVFSLLPGMVLFFFGEPLFTIFFGTKWEGAGYIASVLAIWMVVDFLRATVSQVTIVTKHQSFSLIVSCFTNLLLVMLLMEGIKYMSWERLFLFVSVLLAISAIINLIYFYVLSLKCKTN